MFRLSGTSSLHGEFTLTSTDNKDGTYTIKNIPYGLATDVYTLTETTVPDGYNKADDVTLKGSEFNQQNINVTRTVKETPIGISTILKAKKTLDGKAPDKDNIFTFNLLNSNGKSINSAKNDEEGNIIFEKLTFNESGTYKYKVQEQADSNTGINYDTTVHDVEITLKDKDFFNLTKNLYYGVMDNSGDFYISDIKDSKDFPVYGINWAVGKKNPDSLTSFISFVDPDNVTIEKYITTNRYGSNLKENLRHLVYYFDTHSMSSSDKSAYFFAATNADVGYDTQLKQIYSQIIPDDYKLVLFIPNDTSYQSLIGGYGAKITYSSSGKEESSIVIKNLSGGPRLPDTGGIGAMPIIIAGSVVILIAAVLLIKFRKNEH